MGSLLAKGMLAATKSTPDSIRVAIKASFGTGDRALRYQACFVLSTGFNRHPQFWPIGFFATLDLGELAD